MAEAPSIGATPAAQHGAAGVATRSSASSARCADSRTVDDDRRERLAERGLDGVLPAVVDVDEVEQGAEHAVDVGQSLGAGPCVGCVERELERLDPGGGCAMPASDAS